MEVEAGPGLTQHVLAHGGVLWVRADRRSCCTGSITTLRAGTDRPDDAAGYGPVPTGLPIAVRFRGAGQRRPDRLVLELRGRRRPRPAAYWDGCVYAL
jgi:hypothetical protein